jgi:ornithine carbamoyltransferase
MVKRDYISVADFSREETWDLLLLARRLQSKRVSTVLRGKTIGLIFQKPSTRTAVSFSVGVAELGGHPLLLNADVLQIKRGESPKDTGRVLSRYLSAITIRADRHEDVLEMASYATIPVINGLTNKEHPCQVLADLLTIMNKKKMKHPKQLEGIHLAYFGDGNNMAHSLILAAGLLGMKITLACPKGYEPSKTYMDEAKRISKSRSFSLDVIDDPKKAATNADVLYTDVWTSMGQEAEKEKRHQVLAPYQVNQVILNQAKPAALVMHCLPAHRGEEITEDVLEGPNSVIFDQAENRLHVQKAVLMMLLSAHKRK